MSLTVSYLKGRPEKKLHLTPQKLYENTLEGVTVKQGILTHTRNNDAIFSSNTTFEDINC